MNSTQTIVNKTLFLRRILILRFCYVENSLHFNNLVNFPVKFTKQLVMGNSKNSCVLNFANLLKNREKRC